MNCYLFLTFYNGGSYPRTKGRELATAYLSKSSCVGALKRYAKFGVIEKFWAD